MTEINTMPTYDYVCDACSHEFEAFHSITAKPLRKCPECGKPKLKRLIGTGAGVIFKGSGFYETDYKRNRTSQAGDASSTKGDGSSSEPASKAAKKDAPKAD